MRICKALAPALSSTANTGEPVVTKITLTLLITALDREFGLKLRLLLLVVVMLNTTFSFT
jgi:hypothetical protein